MGDDVGVGEDGTEGGGGLFGLRGDLQKSAQGQHVVVLAGEFNHGNGLPTTRGTHLGLGIMHSMLDDRDNPTQLFSHPILRSTLDESLHSLQGADLGTPTFGLVQDGLEDGHDLTSTLGGRGLDDGVHTPLSRGPDGLSLVHEDVEEVGDTTEQESFGALAETFGETFDEDPGGFPLARLFTLAPYLDDVGDMSGLEAFGVRLVGTGFEGLDEAVGQRFGREGGGGQGERGELVRERR